MYTCVGAAYDQRVCVEGCEGVCGCGDTQAYYVRSQHRRRCLAENPACSVLQYVAVCCTASEACTFVCMDICVWKGVSVGVFVVIQGGSEVLDALSL